MDLNVPTTEFPRLTADDEGICRHDGPARRSCIAWDEIHRVSAGKLDCIAHTVLIVTLDWEFGEFFEIMEDWPGFTDFANAISQRLPGIGTDWLKSAMALRPTESNLVLWERNARPMDELGWLTRPVVCDGIAVADPLESARLTDADLRSICFRLQLIFHTVEMRIAEERLMPIDIFDDMDTLDGMVLHGQRSPSGHSSPPRLSEWIALIRRFGSYYQLAGRGPIVVDPAIYARQAARYGGSSAPT